MIGFLISSAKRKRFSPKGYTVVQVLPLSGWRFDLSQVGSLSEVLAPNCRAISEELQHMLYRQHPCNVVRLIANREEPGDVSVSERAQRADDFFRLWRKEGILVPEHDLAFYVVETTYNSVEGRKSLWSVVGRLEFSTSRDSAGLSGSSNDPSLPVTPCESETKRLLELRQVTRGDFSPVVLLASASASTRDESETDLCELLEKSVRQMTPTECQTESGIRHQLWPVMNVSLRNQIGHAFANSQLTVVDGTEYYLAAKQHATDCRCSGAASGEHDATQTVLVRLIPADQPDLVVLPDLRKSSQRLASEQLTAQLTAAGYQCQKVGDEPYACLDALELAALNEQQPCFAVGTTDGIWHLVFRPDNAEISEIAELETQPIHWTETTESPADVLQHLANKAIRDVMVVRPARTVDDVIRADMGTLSCYETQIAPTLPTGLVLSSFDR